MFRYLHNNITFQCEIHKTKKILLSRLNCDRWTWNQKKKEEIQKYYVWSGINKKTQTWNIAQWSTVKAIFQLNLIWSRNVIKLVSTHCIIIWPVGFQCNIMSCTYFSFFPPPLKPNSLSEINNSMQNLGSGIMKL